LITVITTAYNVGPYIADAIRSALAQTVAELELLVIDDASTDDTWEQASAVADPRVRLLRCSHRGAAGAANFGLEHAHGEFIAFLDGDDLWKPRNLERQLATIQAHPGCEMTFALSRMVDEGGGDLGPTSRLAREPLGELELLQENYCANGSAVMLRRSTVERVGPFATEIGASFDYDYWLRVAHGRGLNVRCVPEVLVLYRRRGGQVTGKWRRMAAGWEQVLRRTEQRSPAVAAAAGRVGTMNMQRYFSYLALEAGEWGAAWRLLRGGFAAAPGRFLTEPRNYLLAGGLVAKAVLPGGTYAELERRVRRSWGRTEV
jgi:glycosyltransferase involved in cell wall biosynthesis